MFSMWTKRKDKAAEDPTSLGNILIKLGWCTQEEVLKASDDVRIGMSLVQMKVITQDQLEEALFRQRQERGQATQVEILRRQRMLQKNGLLAVRAGFQDVAELSLEVRDLAKKVVQGT